MAVLVVWLLVSRLGVLVGGVEGEGREVVYLDEEDVCTCFCERNGHCLTYASSASCYEGGLTLKGEEFFY